MVIQATHETSNTPQRPVYPVHRMAPGSKKEMTPEVESEHRVLMASGHAAVQLKNCLSGHQQRLPIAIINRRQLNVQSGRPKDALSLHLLPHHVAHLVHFSCLNTWQNASCFFF